MNNEPMRGHGASRSERRDSIQNRQRILATARRLFAEQGADETSMNQIAQAAEVGPGTLYRHFAHKGVLCAALLEEDFAAFQERVAALLETPDAPLSAVTRLELLLQELLQMIASHIPLLAGIQEASSGERRRELYQTPFYTWLHTRMSDLLREAIAQGEVSPLDAEFTADAIFAAISPQLLAFQLQGRGFTLARIAAGVRRLFADSGARLS